MVHPDGRIQRLRTAIAHPVGVRAGWSVVAELANRAGLDLGVLTSSMAFAQLVEAVPFYKGLRLEEIGGRGVRWQEREEAGALPSDEVAPARADLGENFRLAKEIAQTSTGAGAPPANGALRLGTYRPIWASPEVEISPALKFAVPHQQAELSPEDARRLGIVTGETIEVGQYGTKLEAKAAVRSGVPEGTIFLATGVASDSANALTEPEVEVRKP